MRKHIALPQQHGSWVLWLGPYAIGIGVGASLNFGLVFLTIAALGAFLALQPLTILVKVLAGRRTRSELAAALFWLICWLVLASLGCLGVAYSGKANVLLLGLAALPVLAWQIGLVAYRAERGQMTAEIVGTGVLALAAPAAFWVTTTEGNTGWWLWILCWLQASGSVVYVYLRLEYRRMKLAPSWPERLRLARGSNILHIANVALVAVFGMMDWIPWKVFFPFAAMLLENIFGGLLYPCADVKPAAIGVRQIVVAAVFTVLMIWAYQ